MTPPTDLLQALSNVLTSLDDAIVVYDARGRFIFMNPLAAQLIGMPSPEVALATPLEQVRSVYQFLDLDGTPLPPERLPHRVALQGVRLPRMEVRYRSLLTGEERNAVLAASPVFDAEGKVHRVISIFRDITAQRRLARSLRFIAEASAALASSLDYNATLRALTRLALGELADLCIVELQEEDGSFLYHAAHADPAKEEAARALVRHPGLTRRSAERLEAARDGKLHLTPFVGDENLKAHAVDEEHLRLLRILDFRTVLIAPLLARGRALGSLLLIRSSGSRPFDEEDRSVAAELGVRAALAVDNARLYREAQAAFLRKDREARINEALQRIGTSFASELDPAKLLQRIADEATRLTGASFGAFLHRHRAVPGAPEPEARPAFLSAGVSAEAAARFPTLWATDLFHSGAGLAGALRCDDLTAPAAVPGPPPPPELLEEPLAARSLLAVPVVSRAGEVLGGLLFGHPRPGAFTGEHQRAVASIAAQAAVALDNARLFQEIRAAQAHLRDSEERLRLALVAGRMGCYDWDLPTDRGIVSPELAQMCGQQPGTSLFSMQRFMTIVHPEDAPEMSRRFQALLREGGEEDLVEFRVVWPDGSVHWLERVGKVIRNEAGRPVRLLGVMLDSTERHLARERMQRLVEELVRSNTELEQFAYIASHDLQEPLRMVASYVQLLARRYQGKLGEDADTFIRFAVDGANRMKALINDLLEYSRVGTSKKPLVPVSCQQILERTLETLQGAIEEAGATVTADPLPMVLGDEVQLGQLFQNLLGNALKFRRPDAPPRIQVGLERRGPEWRFSVRDNGIGIDPQHFDRIFGIFQRLHDPQQYSGTGLGLAICKKIVERHGGRIGVESQPGQGTTFFFTLPAQAQAAAPRRA